ncbi:hypothetical protein [Pseudomonas sp. EA_65y_Pfl2_P78]|uniref:hypothetical protein n=1 Tax=Pseudomonas sp. EA_65y_Pfl2_P78 TaxID=3088695 RepID=UPI0030DD292C
MDIEPHHRERARTLAQHEIGHYVVAKVMGFGTGEVTVELTESGGHKAGAEVFLDLPITDIGAVVSYLERRVVVLFAGALAETLPPCHEMQNRGVNNEKACEIFHSPIMGAFQDSVRTSEALIMLRSVLNQAPCSLDEVDRQISAIGNRLWARTTNLVEQFEDVIVGVAGRLTQELKVSGSIFNPIIRASLSLETLSNIPDLQTLPLLDP